MALEKALERLQEGVGKAWEASRRVQEGFGQGPESFQEGPWRLRTPPEGPQTLPKGLPRGPWVDPSVRRHVNYEGSARYRAFRLDGRAVTRTKCCKLQ